jgi:hypothetical protein
MLSPRRDEKLCKPVQVVRCTYALFSKASMPRPSRRGSHRPPRDFGFETSLWTLSLVAKECVKQGWTVIQVSDETIRQTLKRVGINWKRAKHWMTSPDPQYQVKKTLATA